MFNYWNIPAVHVKPLALFPWKSDTIFLYHISLNPPIPSDSYRTQIITKLMRTIIHFLTYTYTHLTPITHRVAVLSRCAINCSTSEANSKVHHIKTNGRGQREPAVSCPVYNNISNNKNNNNNCQRCNEKKTLRPCAISEPRTLSVPGTGRGRTVFSPLENPTVMIP